ncbi:hypothetical protein D3C80_2101260 [compost metagenome]
MTKSRAGIDKNLQNVVDDLAESPVNSHNAQQLGQKVRDRRIEDANNHHKKVDMDPSH